VVNELKGEKIDVVEWSPDPARFVANALQPAKVNRVRIDPDNQTALVMVPDYQLSLAIGKEGQNARLAARLTGWRIDIKSESQAADDETRARKSPAAPASEEEASAPPTEQPEPAPEQAEPVAEQAETVAEQAEPVGEEAGQEPAPDPGEVPAEAQAETEAPVQVEEQEAKRA
jgi:transcription termination/antitermination protein NusA